MELHVCTTLFEVINYDKFIPVIDNSSAIYEYWFKRVQGLDGFEEFGAEKNIEDAHEVQSAFVIPLQAVTLWEQ